MPHDIADWQATERVALCHDQSGLLGRRQARTDLAEADGLVAEARERLAVAREQSLEPNAKRNVARDEIEAARGALSNHDIYDKWRYLPEHLSAAETRVDALDTWHDWATGKPVDQQRLTEAVTTLRETATHESDDGTRQLGDVLQQWAERHGVELTRPPVDHHQSRRTAIESLR